jgi:hypothetical protein
VAGRGRDFDVAKAQELAKIDEVERRAWDAFERSQQEKQIATQEEHQVPFTVTEKDADGNLVTVVKTKTRKHLQIRREGQSGNPAFLNTILTCIERRCAILGLDAPKRFTVDWDKLTDDEWDKLAQGVPPEKAAPGKVLAA